MKKLSLTFFTFLMVVCFAQTGSASVLYDWGFNINGATTFATGEYDLTGMPVSGTLGAGDLGTLTWSTTAAGSHSFIAWFDYEITEDGDTWVNEYGETSGSPAADQSWEIDEPGWEALGYWGDIYDNVSNGALDNSIGSNIDGNQIGSEDDISFAMGWDFTLAANQEATVNLILSAAVPTGGFYLMHKNSASDEVIYFSSALVIDDIGDPQIGQVPEPSTIILFGLGILGLARVGRKQLT